ncbi:MAG: hypothetical protein R2711_05035 [Acidimicrobiales bacterium]
MSTKPTERARPERRTSYTEPIAALAALAAVFAPAALTGSDAIDMVQRGLLAGFVSFVGAHGRRRTWLLAGGLCALPPPGGPWCWCSWGSRSPWHPPAAPAARAATAPSPPGAS